MKRLIIIRGLPGTGRSTIAHEVYGRRGYEVVEHDVKFRSALARLSGKVPQDDITYLCNRIQHLIDNGRYVAVTGVFNSQSEVTKLLRRIGVGAEHTDILSAVGGTGTRLVYTNKCIAELKEAREEIRTERYVKLDPAQDSDFLGPRRLLAASHEDVEKTYLPTVEVINAPPRNTVTGKLKGMFKNLSDAERERLYKK